MKDSENETSRQLYQEYHQLKDQVNKEGWNDQVEGKQRKLHNKFIYEVFPRINVSIIEIFDNISIEDLNITSYKSIALNENDQILELPTPISYKSLAPFSDPRKCFTYFNDFDPRFRGKKFNLIKLEIKFTHNKLTFPTSEYYSGDFHIALHSPNILPIYIREESFKSLTMHRVNVISYKEIRTTLLPAPYDTECVDYKLDDRGQQNMRSDCIQKCIDTKTLKDFPKIECFSTFANYKLIRRDNLFDLAQLRLCNYNEYNDSFNLEMQYAQINFENQCKKKCLKSCFEQFYDFSIDVTKGHNWVKEYNDAAITLQHSRFPDQIIRHKPIMRWIELVSNFGGLLGMWLGLSIAFLFEYFIKFI